MCHEVGETKRNTRCVVHNPRRSVKMHYVPQSTFYLSIFTLLMVFVLTCYRAEWLHTCFQVLPSFPISMYRVRHLLLIWNWILYHLLLHWKKCSFIRFVVRMNLLTGMVAPSLRIRLCICSEDSNSKLGHRVLHSQTLIQFVVRGWVVFFFCG